MTTTAPASRAMRAVRAAFVMEQTLGHVTHYRNLRAAAATQSEVVPRWLPIRFASEGVEAAIPLVRSNWSARASWRARRAVAAIVSEGVDALFFHTQVTALFSVGYMQGVPTVVSLDATPINFDSVGRYYSHRPAGGGPLDRVKYRLSRRTFHAADRLIAWSDWARRSLVDDYGVDPARVTVLAPGAAREYFMIGLRRRCAETAARADGLVQLLFVGGDFVRKGGPLLLELMRGPLRERCELHLVTAEDVRPQPGVKVHRGVTANSLELARLFHTADVFVLPTMAECFAVALMEAAAAALPVVTTHVGALPEGVVHGETGFLVPPGDAAALARSVELLVASPAMRQRMGAAAYELARSKFDAQRNDRALLDVVRRAATERSHRGRAA